MAVSNANSKGGNPEGASLPSPCLEMHKCINPTALRRSPEHLGGASWGRGWEAQRFQPGGQPAAASPAGQVLGTETGTESTAPTTGWPGGRGGGSQNPESEERLPALSLGEVRDVAVSLERKGNWKVKENSAHLLPCHLLFLEPFIYLSCIPPYVMCVHYRKYK